MDKVAVYCGTRNVYQDMIPSMRSLLIHSDVNKIYFLIEDNEFPYELPPEVECINISNQDYFIQGGPNFHSAWSYMVLLRAAFTKIFPLHDKIISFDNDTIINENISDLWDIDISDYYFAGVREPKKSNMHRNYINNGVLICNLKKLREDKYDDILIETLNRYYYPFAEQDCFPDIVNDKIFLISSDYNINSYTYRYNRKKILHFAAIKDWQKLPIVKKYRNAEIIRNQKENYKLDIIIPYYNNPEGLELTLKSIVYPDLTNITITVVDDCSDIDYEDIKENYPTVNFLRLEQNSGPGVARQYGIEHTSNSHIMFIDTGDYILSKYNLIEITETIKEKSIPYLYLWRWLNAEHTTYSNEYNPLLHGWVIKRELLELYNIYFSKPGSRSNEDSGFMRPCQIIAQELEEKLKIPYILFNEAPVLMYTYDENSMVHADNQSYMYTKHIPGVTINAKHIETILINNHISIGLIIQEISRIMVDLYTDFLRCAKNSPKNLENNWNYIKKFYEETYYKYEKANSIALSQAYSRRLPYLTKMKSGIFPTINLKRFIEEVKESETCPKRYICQT